MAAVDTKQKILDSAEDLFAADGFAATSIRTIVAQAGVNVAAVHYHFGSKEDLLRAVFARRLEPVNQERLRLLGELHDGRVPERQTRDQVEAIVEAFVRPAFLMAVVEGKGPALARLFGRLHGEEGSFVRRVVFEQFRPVVDRYLEALSAELPQLSQAELVHRFSFVIGAMASTLAAPVRLSFLSKGEVDADDHEASLAYLISFCTQGLRGPATTVERDP